MYLVAQVLAWGGESTCGERVCVFDHLRLCLGGESTCGECVCVFLCVRMQACAFKGECVRALVYTCERVRVEARAFACPSAA